MSAEAAWDAQYRAGRYRDEPPVGFVTDILAAARTRGAGSGLYVGCGNGRNFLPLRRAGLDLTGVDVSRTALDQLAERLAPPERERLIHGDVSALPPGRRWPLVIGIQVFQHGDRATAHAAIRAARDRLAPGGLFCLRVNAVGTDVWPEHDVVERDADGGFTVRYRAGPKRGLPIHFFAAAELDALFDALLGAQAPLLAPRLSSTPRAGGPGQWSQWEAIYADGAA